jgi:MOSC domain-containing protein YiiM
MWSGEIVSIHIASSEGEVPYPVDEIRAVEGRGLEGDRYYNLAGKFSRKNKPDREVTLIEAEALDALALDHGIELGPGDSRRNIVTRGVPLNDLVGREFAVGDAVFKGLKLCHPCGYLEEMTKDGVRDGLKNRGGLRAQIISGATIRTGDSVAPV